MQRIPAHVTLRALREMRGLTAAQLVERLRDRGVTVDKDHIYSVELGHKNPGHPLRRAWADELGINPRDLHTGAELREMVMEDDSDTAAGGKSAAA